MNAFTMRLLKLNITFENIPYWTLNFKLKAFKIRHLKIKKVRFKIIEYFSTKIKNMKKIPGQKINWLWFTVL